MMRRCVRGAGCAAHRSAHTRVGRTPAACPGSLRANPEIYPLLYAMRFGACVPPACASALRSVATASATADALPATNIVGDSGNSDAQCTARIDPKIRTKIGTRPPNNVPLDALSTRSLFDYAVGGHAAPVHSLHDIPNASAALETALHERGIDPASFVLWHNILVQPAWSDAEPLLERVAVGTLPQFVLQRVLRKIRTVQDVSGAVRLAGRHMPGFSLVKQDRMVLYLVQHSLQSGGWHAARTLTDMVLAIATRWIDRPVPNYVRASNLLASLCAELVVAGDDARARAAFERVLAFATDPQVGAPVASRIAQATKTNTVRRKRMQACLTVPMVETLLQLALPEDRNALLALGVRVAARQGDKNAATWATELGEHAHEYPGTLSALLRATARTPGGTSAAWALFDHAVHAEEPHHDTHKWVMMLGAAAANKSVPPARVEALLLLHEGDSDACVAHAARWHAPDDIVRTLCGAAPAYTAIVDGFASQGELCRAYAVWDAMVRRGVVPDAWALASLCRLYVRDDRAHDAVVLAKRAAQNSEKQGAAVASPTLLHVVSTLPDPQDVPKFTAPVSTHLLNMLLEALYDAKSGLPSLRALYDSAAALHTHTDIVSLDLLVRSAAAAAQLGSAANREARAVRHHFGELLRKQHPELRRCRSSLSEGATWLLRSELRLQRLEARMRGLFSREPAPINGAPQSHLRFDARVFYHYCELLHELARGPVQDPGAWEELA
ncbi:hypothetical protein MCUN1_003084 [Malassezia cuniculi]|uniref:Pentatricopeptide repeat-containing protein n=1 Tax=Malassezia cuniculi TaxID=948313 RepID=A0AAF0J736_9BASI|nr:hypothetical protein MCUN1_003084 [Malassezia cuniculi]